MPCPDSDHAECMHKNISEYYRVICLWWLSFVVNSFFCCSWLLLIVVRQMDSHRIRIQTTLLVLMQLGKGLVELLTVAHLHFSKQLIVHLRSCVVYNFVRVCLSVSDDNFWKPWRSKFIFAHSVHLQGIRVKFVYEGHRVKVKVIGATNVKNPYTHNVKLRLAITPVP